MNQNRLDIKIIHQFLVNESPFTFIRFSDGETEILKNRQLIIGNGKVLFKGTTFRYKYPDYDQKSFLPERDNKLHSDLMESLLYSSDNFFKGIPTSHNSATDKKYYLKLLKNRLTNVTFADLFINNNFRYFEKIIFPIIRNSPSVYAICNFNAKPYSFIKDHVPIPSDCFKDYCNLLPVVLNKLSNLPQNSLILSSASSLSNIIGWKLNVLRPDLTFLDLGTSINHYLGLDSVSRVYHVPVFGPKNIRDIKMFVKHYISGKYRIRW